MNLSSEWSGLVCPLSKVRVTCRKLEDVERETNGGAPLLFRQSGPAAVGRTEYVMARDDGHGAYPIVDGTPVLLGPEMLMPAGDTRDFDVTIPQYDEAYSEMAFYNGVATKEAESIRQSEAFAAILPVLGARDDRRVSFPSAGVWLDAAYDSSSQHDAYSHLCPVSSTSTVLQMGGKGIHAVKLLLAGAGEAWLITPMVGEVLCAQALAREAGVDSRLRCVAGVAEELPFADGMFDAIYAGGCLHHFVTELALPECARVLREGGRFAAVDPWRAPLYALGTRIFGRREKGAFCRPLTKERVAPLFQCFQRAEVRQHGALTRYPLLALNKLGVSCPVGFARKVYAADDAVCSCLGLRGFGSSAAVLAWK